MAFQGRHAYTLVPKLKNELEVFIVVCRSFLILPFFNKLKGFRKKSFPLEVKIDHLFLLSGTRESAEWHVLDLACSKP